MAHLSRRSFEQLIKATHELFWNSQIFAREEVRDGPDRPFSLPVSRRTLVGNLQLFIPGEEGRTAFNEYALFMTTFPLVKVLSYLTYASVLFHVVDGLILTIQNRRARPAKYAVEKGSANANWSSRNMALLGTIVLVFLVTHMQNFWWKMHFGNMPRQLLKTLS